MTYSARLLRWLLRPVDVAGLAAFRVAFGVLLLASVIRTVASGWVELFFSNRTFFFKYWGFEWVVPWPEPGMYVHFGVLGVLALMITLGLFYRASITLFFLGFTWVELIDVTNYLNHYYLVSLLCFLGIFLPLHRAWSLDAWRDPSLRTATVPAWTVNLLRFQVGLVYFYAGLAKLGSDWLIYAQPLGTWLAARTDLPVLGPLFHDPIWAHVFSWSGFLFDTTIVGWLLWSRTRPFAYAMAVAFHFVTGSLFEIGMFPFIMVTAALIFFSPSWPRRWLPASWARVLSKAEGASSTGAPVGREWTGPLRAWALLGALFAALQLLVPLRHYAYDGNVLWNEQGMRWSWKVKVRAKRGSVTYRVTLPDAARSVLVNPRRYLTPYQAQEMASQPDLILQLAHHIARDFERRGHSRVEVRVDAIASLNGRAAAPLVDPEVNLVSVRDGLGQADWILPAPDSPPLRMARR